MRDTDAAMLPGTVRAGIPPSAPGFAHLSRGARWAVYIALAVAAQGCILAGDESARARRPSPVGATARAVPSATPVASATLSSSPSSPTASPSVPPEAPQAPAHYAVREGDTLPTVARRLSIAPRELAALNGVAVDAALRAGQQLRLPEGVWSERLGIRLTRPQGGERVRTPVLVEGTAATFEGVVIVEALAADGARLAQVTTKAIGPDVGLHGPFQATLSLPPAGMDRAVTLRLYWPSPRDGSPQDEIRVPMTVLGVSSRTSSSAPPWEKVAFVPAKLLQTPQGATQAAHPFWRPVDGPPARPIE